MPTLSQSKVARSGQRASRLAKGSRTPRAVVASGGGGAVVGALETQAKLWAMDPSGTRRERNALKRGLEQVANPVKAKYRSNFPGTNKHHKLTVWHYRRYPPRGSGADTVRVGVDRIGVYIGAGGRGRQGQNRGDMRAKELGRGRHPTPHPDPAKRLWFPIPHKPFIRPTVTRLKRVVAEPYSQMIARQRARVGLRQ